MGKINEVFWWNRFRRTKTLKIGLLDENGNLIFNIYVKTNSKDGYELTSKRLAENFKLEIEKKGINYEDVLAIGMGVHR